MQEFTPIKEGKVREIYDNGDSLIIVATDRISAFDVILKNKITNKGAILTQMSRFWFDFTKDIVPNHMISVDVKDMPEFFQQEQFEGNSMMCHKLDMIPIECIVRGYITGSGCIDGTTMRRQALRGGCRDLHTALTSMTLCALTTSVVLTSTGWCPMATRRQRTASGSPDRATSSLR